MQNKISLFCFGVSTFMSGMLLGFAIIYEDKQALLIMALNMFAAIFNLTLFLAVNKFVKEGVDAE